MAYVLDYHCYCETAVIHCDVKPSNVLLDDDMVAHLGDFGLSRLVADAKDRNQSSSMGVRGTVGYAAPGASAMAKVSSRSFALIATLLMVIMLSAVVLSTAQAQPAPARAPSNDGTSVDQGIAYVLMRVALALTYLIHC
ncbi:putative LRR receptor-like serine/threonine-protein kinase [Drosera capensis]